LQNKRAIFALTIEHFSAEDGTPKSKEVFERETSLILTDAKYNVLLGLVRTAVHNFGRGGGELPFHVPIAMDSVQNFCMRTKKGSKKFRKVLSGNIQKKISTNIAKYADLTDTVINLERSLILNVQWGMNFYDNSMRTFLFKLHNNLLGLNCRVANFVRGHPRTCTFCDLARVGEDNAENTKHLFFHCTVIYGILQEFFEWVFNNNYEIGYRDYFTGYNFENVNKNRTLDIVLNLVKKIIWDCKLRYHIPTLNFLKTTFLNEIKKLYKNSKTVRELVRKSELFVFHEEIRF